MERFGMELVRAPTNVPLSSAGSRCAPRTVTLSNAKGLPAKPMRDSGFAKWTERIRWQPAR